MNKETLHVVLALQDKTGDYSRHTGVVMQSILKNTVSDIHFHIFHDDTLNLENIQNFKSICMHFSMKIDFYFVKLPLNANDLTAIKYLSIGALYRLDIMNQLKNIDKVLYLDSDIVVTMDITDLFNLDLDNNLIAAVHDEGVGRNAKLYLKSVRFDLKKYFNSGVILFDLKQIRTKYDLLQECLNFFKKYPKDPFPDQAALNYIFQSKCKLIDKKYNSVPNIHSNINDRCIWHFAGGYKPWQARTYEVDFLYWEYLAQTPWGNSMKKLFLYYSKTVEPLDVALLKYPTGSKRKFFRNICVRVLREIKEVKDKYSLWI